MNQCAPSQRRSKQRLINPEVLFLAKANDDHEDNVYTTVCAAALWLLLTVTSLHHRFDVKFQTHWECKIPNLP